MGGFEREIAEAFGHSKELRAHFKSQSVGNGKRTTSIEIIGGQSNANSGIFQPDGYTEMDDAVQSEQSDNQKTLRCHILQERHRPQGNAEASLVVEVLRRVLETVTDSLSVTSK